MNPGLRYLLGAGVRGVWRRARRRMRTFRGFVSTMVGTVFFLVLLGSQLMVLLVEGDAPPPHDATVQGFCFWFLLLLVPALLAADAPFFWPQEVQFLFAAPVSRRELMVYQLLSRGWVQVLSGLWFALLTMRMAYHPAAAIPAVVLATLFLYTVTQLAALLRLRIGDLLPAAAGRAVRPLLWIAGGALGFSLYRDAQAVGFGAAVGDAFDSPLMRAATLPVRPFGELFAAQTTAAAVAWTGVCAAMVAAAAGGALWMDVDFRERSLVSSARRFERMRRIRGGRGGIGAGTPKNRRLRVPAFAFLGSAAPVARRQAYELGRGLRTLWSLALPAVMAFVYVIALPSWMGPPGEDGGPLGTSLVILVVVFAMLASGGFSIDFRRDVERLAYLRSLPLRPGAVAVGEVFLAAALIGIAGLLLLAGSAAVMDWRVAPRMAALAAAIALPVAWLSVTLENWIFLLFPTRVQGDGENQSSFLGKQLIKMFFKLCVLGVVAAAAGVTAVAGGWLAGTPGAGAGAVIVIVAACWGVTLLLARAYRGFDLTVDTPTG
ncbi:MAG TPA: putative ABC exporter domain-containing protein [Longimicrobium sp.]|nr:putative ABC exporter domain-containing protein [Longimicrobium sp.]